MKTDKWRIWDNARPYGDSFFKRAVGELPEMESSKKLARELKRVTRHNDRVLDVGCGGGHYLRSLRREIGDDVSYTGVDATEYYIRKAREAYANDSKAEFLVSDIFNLDLQDESFDLVMCNNVLLHLPSIRKPLEELVRVARRSVFVRFLVGERSFRIQDVHPESGFGADGEPTAFHYYNIYSRAYVASLMAAIPRVKHFTITRDDDFDRERILESAQHNDNPFDATTMIGDYQLNGYVLQPWSILEISLE